MRPRVARIKVLSVVGAGRSGTTVLASILGEVDRFASAGELRWLWERGVIEQRPCGCGERPSACPVWSPVIRRTLSVSAEGQSPWTAEQIVAAQHHLATRRNLLGVLRSGGGGETDWEALQCVRAVISEACAAYADITGAGVIVDTSKRPVDAAVLASLPEIDHYVLHLVRDPRAVAHSWRRAKVFSAAGHAHTMGTRRLPATVRRWIANCLSAEILHRQIPGPRWMSLRYEDFARDPRASVENILSFLAESGAPPFEDDYTVRLGPNHIVAGNPSRFTTGLVTIKADEEWRSQMSARDQRLVELLTLPLMQRYGYSVMRHRP